MNEQVIPIIDISNAFSFFNKDPGFKDASNDVNIQTLAKEIFSSLTKFGFLYIKGHGISVQTISTIYELSRNYFNLPIEEKHKFLYKDEKLNFCYVPSQCEQFASSSVQDMKEAFDFIPTENESIQKQVPQHFYQSFNKFFSDSTRLTLLLLQLITLGYDQSATEYFQHTHQGIGCLEKNISTLRTLYYPAINKNLSSAVDQARCSEHTDYGTLTLLFQDDVGGLEVESHNGEYKPIVPIKGTIVVNAADLLERWTSGVIKSARHRVTLPKDTTKPRQSIAFFCQPDNDVIVHCLDGSEKYEPVTVIDYLNKKFKRT